MITLNRDNGTHLGDWNICMALSGKGVEESRLSSQEGLRERHGGLMFPQNITDSLLF